MKVWRLTSTQYADRAFDGEGARLYGGRWNPEGVAVVYTAEHLSLAILEQLVHLRPERKLAPRVAISADIPDDLPTERLDFADLPDDWRTVEGNADLKDLGRDWVDRAETALLDVPSVLVPQERNIVINPYHADFETLDIAPPEPFEFDPRLLS
ncbi:MAG: RES family NAD+ phosphorylase [Persicimonas sp.]